MLIPYAIDEDTWWVEDTETISRIKVGMEGIFTPWVYDREESWEQNGATLIVTDLAPCGLGDGVRWAFLETEQGLVFDRASYSGAANAKTLDEIQEYVIKKLH